METTVAKAWVDDRWHLKDPGPDDPECGKHKSRVRRMVASAKHGQGARYAVRYYDESGKPREERKDSAGNPLMSLPQAEERRDEIKAQLARGIWLAPEDRKLTFGGFGDAQMEKVKRGNPGTYTRKETLWRLHIKSVIGSKPLTSMSVAVLEDWKAGLSGAASSQKNMLRVCKSLLRPAVAQGLTPNLNEAGLKSIRPPRQTKKKIIPWEQGRTTQVISSLTDPYEALGECWAHLGMRQGEGFALSPEDIDEKRGFVHCQWQIQLLKSGDLVFQPLKDREDRQIPLLDQTVDVLAHHSKHFDVMDVTLPVWEGETVEPIGQWRRMTRALFFTDESGKPLHRTNFNRNVWDPALERAGVIAPRLRGAKNHSKPRGCGCHALRHYYARFMLEAGVAIEALSEHMGHATPGYTLDTYGHLRPGHMASSRALANRKLASS
jgi:integrase